MHNKIRVIISIVISAVLLGIVVVYCIRTWMPAELVDWASWGILALCGVYAIFRIASLAKLLGDKDNE